MNSQLTFVSGKVMWPFWGSRKGTCLTAQGFGPAAIRLEHKDVDLLDNRQQTGKSTWCARLI